MMKEKLEAFERLLVIMDELRTQCPWDSKQTLESLRYLTIEEVYELSDAILEGDLSEVEKELGDLFLHLVFYAKIGEEKAAFNVATVLNGICDKLVRRHPHIYGDVKVDGEEDVKSNWEKIKLAEGRKSVLGGVPNSLPAMVKAHRIQEKARGVGFDWENVSQVWEKVMEELGELQVEVNGNGDDRSREDEFGDLLFALINYARFIGVNPEDALERTNRKFIRRFRYIEDQAELHGKNISSMSLQEMEEFWQLAKKLEIKSA